MDNLLETHNLPRRIYELKTLTNKGQEIESEIKNLPTKKIGTYGFIGELYETF